MPEPLKYWLKGMPRAQRDLIVILALAVPVYALLIWADAFDSFFEFSRSHEDYQLDEFVALLFFIGLAAIVFSVRRILDLRSEIRQRRAAEDEAHRLARHDPLTGLPNRRRFLEEFNTRVSEAGAKDQCALFVVDLDYFKPINDLYGHRLGDEVLRVIARRLSDIVEDRGIVARLGGDEFGIVLPATDEDLPLRIARRIVHDIPRPIKLASLSLEIGTSVGVATWNRKAEHDSSPVRDGSPVETVLRQADMAMYCAKADGRGGYHFFDKNMDERLQHRVRLEREISNAVERGEIIPYYQPLVDLHTRETVGYELLARWKHPVLGVIEPSEFIPIAEDTGVIGRLTDTLLIQGLKDAKEWPPHIYLTINLSPRQFADPLLAQRILGLLAEAAFPPGRLEIEIAETAVVQRLEEAKSTLKSLRNLGVRIALDDFGTGYSGLHHLRELQLDTIKIDQSFVTDMLNDEDDQKLVRAIVSLGHVLGLRTTAEGIETKDVLDKLLSLGCDTGQGFLFGRPEPMTAADVAEELSVRRSA
ncbi:MAG: EAL domain-containing protein [Hyphomicrobiales bacterium]